MLLPDGQDESFCCRKGKVPIPTLPPLPDAWLTLFQDGSGLRPECTTICLHSLQWEYQELMGSWTPRPPKLCTYTQENVPYTGLCIVRTLKVSIGTLTTSICIHTHCHHSLCEPAVCRSDQAGTCLSQTPSPTTPTKQHKHMHTHNQVLEQAFVHMGTNLNLSCTCS